MDRFDGSLFELLPIGAYRSSAEGRQLRANSALVRLNGYDNEAELLAAVNDIGREWYVEPDRRAGFQRLMQRDGQVLDFVSEVHRHKTRERIWVRENAHVVRGADGAELYYEGTVEDITGQRLTELALRRQRKALSRLHRELPGADAGVRCAWPGDLCQPGIAALAGPGAARGAAHAGLRLAAPRRGGAGARGAAARGGVAQQRRRNDPPRAPRRRQLAPPGDTRQQLPGRPGGGRRGAEPARRQRARPRRRGLARAECRARAARAGAHARAGACARRGRIREPCEVGVPVAHEP